MLDAVRIAELLQPFAADVSLEQGPGCPIQGRPPWRTALSGVLVMPGAPSRLPLPGWEPSPELVVQLQTYLDLLLRWNARINLTAIRDPEQIVTRHFGESLFAARVLRSAGALAPERPLADIGSGAGFPGIPIKLFAPELHVTLIESQNKKATFLREVIRTLGLSHIVVHCGRAENWGRQRRHRHPSRRREVRHRPPRRRRPGRFRRNPGAPDRRGTDRSRRQFAGTRAGPPNSAKQFPKRRTDIVAGPTSVKGTPDLYSGKCTCSKR